MRGREEEGRRGLRNSWSALMDRSVFGPPQWRTAAVMYRRTADVIPIVALKNPFAERDRIRRRRFRYTAR